MRAAAINISIRNGFIFLVRRFILGGRVELRQFSLPPIQVSIFSGAEEVTIKVADQGGGIPPEKLARVWDYAYTTVRQDGAPRQFACIF